MSPQVSVQIRGSVEIGGTDKKIENMFYNREFIDRISKVNEEIEQLMQERKTKLSGSPQKP